MLTQEQVRLHTSSNLIVVHWTDTVSAANRTMRDHSIRHAPVVNDSGVIVGILSDRDVQRASRPGNPLEFDPSALAIDFMSRPVISIDQTDEIKEAARKMVAHGISSLVVTANGFAVGVITTNDLLEAMINADDSFFNEAKNKVTSAILRSPVGGIVNSLANAGI